MTDAAGLAEQLRAHGVTGPGPDYPSWLAEQLVTSDWWFERDAGLRLWGALSAPALDPIDVDAAVDRAARVRRRQHNERVWTIPGRQGDWNDLPEHVREHYRRAVRPYVEAALAEPDDSELDTIDDSGGSTTWTG